MFDAIYADGEGLLGLGSFWDGLAEVVLDAGITDQPMTWWNELLCRFLGHRWLVSLDRRYRACQRCDDVEFSAGGFDKTLK